MNKFAEYETIMNALCSYGHKTGGGPVVYQDENNIWHPYTGEQHALYVAPTGKGKSQYGIFPLLKSLIENGESVVLVDPKGECTGYFQHLQDQGLVSSDANITIIDMTNPEKSMGFNIFDYPFDLLKSNDSKDRQLGDSFVYDLVNATCIESSNLNETSFWNNCSKSTLSGLTYLFSKMAGSNSYPTPSFFNTIMNQASSDIIENAKYLDKLCEVFDPEEGNATNNLGVYTNSQIKGTFVNTVIRDIRTTFLSDIRKWQGDSAIDTLMSHNDFSISNLDLDKQNIIIIIKPDNFEICDMITGVFISQLSQYLIAKADNYYDDRRLPIRFNFILEELGNIGKAIPTLPQLMTAARSRNVRLALVLQDMQQLDFIYKENARTILSNIGVTIAFGSEDPHTRQLLSARCGHYFSDYDPSRESLVLRPEDIGKMRVGQALIFLSGGVVFVSDLAQIRDAAGYRLNRDAFLIHKSPSSDDAKERFQVFFDNAILHKYKYLLDEECPSASANEIKAITSGKIKPRQSTYSDEAFQWGILALLYQKRFGIDANFHFNDVFNKGIPFDIPHQANDQHYSWLVRAMNELDLKDYLLPIPKKRYTID